jgi:hypothetical protein
VSCFSVCQDNCNRIHFDRQYGRMSITHRQWNANHINRSSDSLRFNAHRIYINKQLSCQTYRLSPIRFSARRGVQHLSLPNTFLRRAAMLKTLCIIIHYLAPPICSIRHAMHSRAMARAHRVPSAPSTPIFPMDVDFAVPCQSSAPVRLESDSHSSAYVFCSDLPPKNPASRQCPCASLTLYLDLVG